MGSEGSNLLLEDLDNEVDDGVLLVSSVGLRLVECSLLLKIVCGGLDGQLGILNEFEGLGLGGKDGGELLRGLA